MEDISTKRNKLIKLFNGLDQVVLAMMRAKKTMKK